MPLHAPPWLPSKGLESTIIRYDTHSLAARSARSGYAGALLNRVCWRMVVRVSVSLERRARQSWAAFLVAFVLLSLVSTPAAAYIGPGAGFALVSSFLVVFTTIIIAFISLLIWPFRTLWRIVRRLDEESQYFQR